MKISEAIVFLRRWLEVCESEPADDHSAVKALTVALEAMHRRDPMKPLDNGHLLCPMCARYIQEDKPNYCPDCGQRIEWNKTT